MTDSVWVNRYKEENPLTAYEPAYVFRIGVTVLVVAALAVMVLAQTGALCHFTQSMQSLFQSTVVVWKPIALSVAAVVVITGTAIVIHRARKNLASGKIFGRSHWKTCYVSTSSEGQRIRKAHLDMSFVKNGNGRARLYTKEIGQATQTGLLAALSMPLYTITVMLYHLGRLIAAPVYILCNLHKFSLLDIPKEMLRSLWCILKAPFYGLALFCAALYATLDPLNGIKLGSAIEYEWNDHVPMRDEGIWMMGGKIFKNWKWENGKGSQAMGRNGFYFAGSWLPEAEVVFQDSAIIRVEGVEGASYDLTTQIAIK